MQPRRSSFANGLTVFFAVLFLIVVAFGIRDWRATHSLVRMIAPVVIGAFIVLFYFFARGSGNDLGPR